MFLFSIFENPKDDGIFKWTEDFQRKVLNLQPNDAIEALIETLGYVKIDDNLRYYRYVDEHRAIMGEDFSILRASFFLIET